MARGTINGDAGTPVRRRLRGVVRCSMTPVTIVGQTLEHVVLMTPGTRRRRVCPNECEACRAVIEMPAPRERGNRMTLLAIRAQA